MLRYFAQLLQFAQRQSALPPAQPGAPPPAGAAASISPSTAAAGSPAGVPGGSPAPRAAGLAELAGWLRDECCKVLGMSPDGGEGGGTGGPA